MVRVHPDPPLPQVPSAADIDLIIEHMGMCWIIQSDGVSNHAALTSYREKHRYRLENVSETLSWSQDQERYCSKSSTLTAPSKDDAWESYCF